MAKGIFPFTRIAGGKFEKIWRCVVYADGERAKIMKGRYFDISGIYRIYHAWKKTDADAVAKLGILEPHITDFL
jgi:hypothetical protein